MQDNVLAHTSQVAMVAATKCSFEVLPHSRILLQAPFGLLFPNLKTDLLGRKFGSSEGVIDAVDEYWEPERRLLF